MTFSQFKEILLSVTQDSQTVVIPDDMSASTKINELPLDSIHIVELSMEIEGLCCTNHVRDSSRESSVVAGGHEQTDAPGLQDKELAHL